MNADMINGSLELVGGVLLYRNCWVLFKDKEVKGVSIFPIVFFSLWGVWNLYYYPSLNQWFSFFGGCIIASANALWVVMALHYSRIK